MKWRVRVRIRFMTALVTSLILFLPLLAFAGGVNHQPLGVEDYLIGVTPPPSIAGKVFLGWYNADTLKTNSGRTSSIARDGVALDKLNVYVEVNRVLWITPFKLQVGGFDGFINAHAVFPFVKPNLHLDTPGGDLDQSHSGLADATFGAGVAWHHKSGFLHGITALDIIAPTGQWNPKRLVNVGANCWTISPVFIFTVFPPFYPDIDISMKIDYSFNTTNDDFIIPNPGIAAKIGNPALVGLRTHNRPGQEFHFDYDVMHAIWGGKPGMQFRGGIGGYFYHQTTDDKTGFGKVKDDLGRVFAIGPALMFDYKMWIFSAHVYFETAAKNRTEGIASQLTILCKF